MTSLHSPATAAPSSPRLAELVRRLWRHVAPRRRRQLSVLLVLTVFTSFFEVLSIGAVLPFLGALAAPEKVFASRLAAPAVHLLGLTAPAQVILPLTVMFCLAGLVAGAMRILMLRVSLRLSFALGADLCNEVYRRTLFQPYAVHIARNSSQIINVISTKTSETIFYVIMPGLGFVGSVFIGVSIVATLMYLIPLAALAVFVVFGVLYALLIKKLRSRLKVNSVHIAKETTNGIKFLQEGLGGIRDILIDGSQETFIETFRRSDAQLRSAQDSNQFIAQSPRYIMESAGMVVIAGIAYGLTRTSTGVNNVIPTLAALALGLQRLLPALQQSYQAWSTVHGAQDSLRDTLDLLDQPMPAVRDGVAATITHEREIRLRDVSFRYGPTTPWILRHVDLVIRRGARIGFVGTTGSGKSTMLDMIMGLLTPTQGQLEVDGVAIDAHNLDDWRRHIAHVPQTIFLTDNSVSENIAFGVRADQIDHAAVRQAAHLAQIGETIDSWSQGYATVVGERGVQLSGGQRQRIGIARALYKKASVIVLDEATSALDSATEAAVMKAIESLSSHVTLLIIAHRLSTLKNCDQVVELHKPDSGEPSRVSLSVPA